MLLYIHIPFCDSKCAYCAFNSYVDKFHLQKEYMDALQKQLQFELKRYEVQYKSIETVFIGGGTPSTIDAKLYAPLFTLLSPYIQDGIEITSEANPNSASYAWLAGMYALGVNRISFGVQSFHESKLKLLNRAHTPFMAQSAIQNAAEIGYKNISLDLIYATLGDTRELLEKDLTLAFTLPINHLSAYALTIEEGTAFATQPHMSKEQLELTTWLFESIQNHGFRQYEISNFGTYHSAHNKGYWLYKDYIGLGAGAVGKLKDTRYYPSPVIEKYIKNPLNISTETLDTQAQHFEQLFLGLRSCVGVAKELLSSEELQKAHTLLEEKKLFFQKGVFYNEDYLLADEIALFISS